MNTLAYMNEKKLKESEQNHEALKSQIMEKCMQMFSWLFEEQAALNEKADRLQETSLLKKKQIMRESSVLLSQLQHYELKINMANDLNTNSLNEIETNTQNILTRIAHLKEQLNRINCSYGFKSEVSFLKLGQIFVSLFYI